MAGNRRDIRALAEEFRQLPSVEDRVMGGAVNRGKSAAELPPQNRFNRRASILEDMVVDEDEPRAGYIESLFRTHGSNRVQPTRNSKGFIKRADATDSEFLAAKGGREKVKSRIFRYN
jgi:hypothetical protein